MYMYVSAVQSAGVDCAHGQRIRANVDFYQGWVLPKIRSTLSTYLTHTQ